MEERKVINLGKGKELNDQETLEAFFEALKVKDCKYVDIKKLITPRQQIGAEIVGKRMVEAHINGIWEIVNCCTEIKIKKKISTNKMMKTFKLIFVSVNKIYYECTTVKENDLGKPDINGIWGVNVESFKLVKP